MSEQILEWLSIYGLPVSFFILAASAFGIPVPAKAMMLVVGSFIQQGDFELWQALLIGITGAVIGDQIGYSLGRFGGQRLIDKLTYRFGGGAKLEQAQEFSTRWGATGVFFSRWLVTPLGPWINVSSGVTGYSWARFSLWGVFGESLWVFLYIMLGIFFSDRVQDTANVLLSLTWVFVGITIAAILGWELFNNHRPSSKQREPLISVSKQ